MYKIVQKEHAALRVIAESKIALNYITKDVSPSLSLAITEAYNHSEKELCDYDRIYFILEGAMTIEADGDTFELNPEEACYIARGTKYSMQGTFKAVVVNTPAYGSASKD